jgi:hypothetical protein
MDLPAAVIAQRDPEFLAGGAKCNCIHRRAVAGL